MGEAVHRTTVSLSHESWKTLEQMKENTERTYRSLIEEAINELGDDYEN